MPVLTLSLTYSLEFLEDNRHNRTLCGHGETGRRARFRFLSGQLGGSSSLLGRNSLSLWGYSLRSGFIPGLQGENRFRNLFCNFGLRLFLIQIDKGFPMDRRSKDAGGMAE